MSGAPSKEKVRRANREFYDLVAGQYEAIDGRRSDGLIQWLTGLIWRLHGMLPQEKAVEQSTLLDLGAGGGLVSRCARGIFARRIAVDISHNILAAHATHFDAGVCADVEALPFEKQSLDAVMAFATLHHLHGFEAMVQELARVLAPGGVFCSDHDMDAAFHARFRHPLRLYRKLRDAKGQYVRSVDGITEDMYALTEHQEQGIDAAHLATLLRAQGFTVRLEQHWYGLTPVTDRVFGRRSYPRGLAPVVRVWAINNSDAQASSMPGRR